MSHNFEKNKLFIRIFLILLIAFIIPNVICYWIEKEKMREGGMWDFITDPIDDIIDGVEDITTGISKVIDFIGSIPQKITDWGNGVSNHVKCGGEEFEYGWTNTFKIIDVLFACFWDKFIKFFNGNCTRYYLIDLIIGLTYGLFIQLPIILINAILGVNLQPIVDFLYELIIVPLDAIMYSISGYHLIKWSDGVINECYKCKWSYKFASGRSIDLYKYLDEWAKLLNCSTEQMKDGILKIYTSLVPSAKWGAWIEGKHLKGYDDKPDFWG